MQIAGRIRPDEAELIRSEPDPLKLLDLLEEGRITNSNHPYLLRKLLPHEAVVIPALLSKLSESDQDALIEQGIRFLNKTTGFPLPQLEELALSASSPYVRSCVCLLLGVRGPETVLPLLWRQFHLLRTAHPEESLSEGPLYGLYELAVRFGRISLKFPEHL
ncbi:hypothetical protein B8V81_2376 [Paenibacillus pasadenensis]|uniref:Uncharacterized protein n=2 Tax=Paenibacillus TaxID=44249 RepID=A0A2N5N0U6_9BACL|nr:hypothetical protein B8V81_2376 [Paenibacillus pasadenensis]